MLHHLIFKVLVKIGPIVYFCLGVIFTLLLEIYLTLLVLNANEDEYRENTKHLYPKKQLSIEKRLKILKRGTLKNIDAQPSISEISGSEFNVSEIDKEEIGINQ